MTCAVLFGLTTALPGLAVVTSNTVLATLLLSDKLYVVGCICYP